MINVSLFGRPDEAFLIKLSENNYHLKILEKKNQNCSGSIEEKLKTGDFTRREYLGLINNEINSKKLNVTFKISFGFCISKYLEDKLKSNSLKYKIWNNIFKEDNIFIFYGDDINYKNKLYEWVIQN